MPVDEIESGLIGFDSLIEGIGKEANEAGKSLADCISETVEAMEQLACVVTGLNDKLDEAVARIANLESRVDLGGT